MNDRHADAGSEESEISPQVALAPGRYRRVEGDASDPGSLGGSALDSLPDPVIAIDASGTLLYVNRVVTDVLGWEPDDIVGRSVLDLLHPDDLNIVLASMATVTTKKVGELIMVRALTAHGSWMALEVRGAVQGAGDDHLNVLVLRDTTHRHRLELDQGEVGVLRSVMANMHGMIALVEPDGSVRSINGAVTRILGYDPELIPGQQFTDFLHVDDRAQVVDVISALGPHESAHLDARFTAASGES
ncbi:MAG: PAS domain S-box protein, partial [Ilumatobacter sp.]